jgi:SAM-dependent methyltransferase
MGMNVYIGVGQGEIHAQHQQVMDSLPGTWIYIDKFVRRPDTWPMDGAALAFKDNSLGAVYASHVLEHFPQRETRRVLAEWFRVRRPAGALRLNVPDLDWACAAWLNPALRTDYFRDDQKFLEIFYGGQDTPGEFHYTAFSQGSLRGLLYQTGLERVSIETCIDAHDMGVLIATAIT